MKALTPDGGALRDTFVRDGYVQLPGFRAGEELAEIERNLTRFIDEIVPTLPSDEVFYEDKRDRTSLKQIQRMHDHDPFFKQLIVEGPFRVVAEQLLGDRVVPKNLQYFNKPPGVGQPTPPHQDGFYFMLDPCEAVTMWFGLDEVDAENGCVRYLPGSNRQGMRPHTPSDTLGFSQSIANYGPADSASEVAAVARPGDLLAHHALTVHLAGANRSVNRQRRSLGFIYYSQSARVDEAKHQEYRRRLVQELAASGKI
ncbi:Phytanoyl-CoA dioxygenase (PhyH) [Pirellulimonas nuda]|uniref:Phytanoyl-CoA dioxygenase (PhyH) n=2 Tax=Pirellulimonas nuda TaxID=2528009 RepID=A0A518DG70_9BACT|nr:Phytanoyl-CoA dioxygenase (PhyH) [Pirellulimonas nuda]